MTSIEKVNINKETVTFHTLTEEREYSLESYHAFLAVELICNYPKAGEWDIESLIETMECEGLINEANERFIQSWNDEKLIYFKGKSTIKKITSDEDTYFPPIRGKEILHNNKKVTKYILHEIEFENGLEGRLISSKELDLFTGQELVFELTKTYGKYTRDYKKGGYYYPIYYSITLLQDVKKVKVRKQSLVAA
jgi:hypothetical protein